MTNLTNLTNLDRASAAGAEAAGRFAVAMFARGVRGREPASHDPAPPWFLCWGCRRER
jgi:hypothetical protein